MTATAQDLANRIGKAQRATEAAIAAGDLTAAATHAAEQHQNLTDGFALLRDQLGLELDWDQIAGNAGSAKGAHTNGGGSKDSPPQAD